MNERDKIIAEIAASFPLEDYINDANNTRMRYCMYCRRSGERKPNFDYHDENCIWVRSKALMEAE